MPLASSILLLRMPLLHVWGRSAGLGVDTDQHAATLTKGVGSPSRRLDGCFTGCHGQILEAFSISAGLDYPGIGPEHSYFHDIKRATYMPVTDQEA